MIEKREDCLTESKEIMGIVEVNVDVLLFLRHLKQSVRASFRSRRRGWIPWSWGGVGCTSWGVSLSLIHSPEPLAWRRRRR